MFGYRGATYLDSSIAILLLETHPLICSCLAGRTRQRKEIVDLRVNYFRHAAGFSLVLAVLLVSL